MLRMVKRCLLAAYGYRDHSWGYRNEVELDGWHWVWAHFPDSLIHFANMHLGDNQMTTGYVITEDTVVRIDKVESEVTERDENGVPIASTHKAIDVNGKSYTVHAKTIFPFSMPWPDPEGSIGKRGQCVLCEQLSTFTWEETGEQGVGSDEHGKLCEPNTWKGFTHL